jgi:hypothetical protein
MRPWTPASAIFKLRFPAAEAWQVSATGTEDFVSPEGIRVCNALVFLRGLP